MDDPGRDEAAVGEDRRMNLLTLLGIAVGLAIDAFAVSIGIGLKQC